MEKGGKNENRNVHIHLRAHCLTVAFVGLFIMLAFSGLFWKSPENRKVISSSAIIR